MSLAQKIKKNVHDNFPVYTYAAGVVLGSVATAAAIKPHTLAVAAKGYNLAMVDVRQMVKNGVDLENYFLSLDEAKTIVTQQL